MRSKKRMVWLAIFILIVVMALLPVTRNAVAAGFGKVGLKSADTYVQSA